VLGDHQMEHSSAEKDPGVLVDCRLTMSYQSALAVKKVNSILSCIRNSAASLLRDMIIPLCSALLRRHLECWIQC